MTFTEKFEASRKAGYSDEEIYEQIKSSPSYADKIAQSEKAGYQPKEIISFLSEGESRQKEPFPDSPMGGEKPAGSGLGSLMKSATRGIGKGISDISAAASRADTASLPVMLGIREPVEQAITEETIDEWIPKDINEDPLSRIAEKGARYGTFGALFGPSGVLPSIISGTVGQSLEEAGAPKWAVISGEILSGLFTPGSLGAKGANTEKQIASLGKNKQLTEMLKKTGLDEATIQQVQTAMSDPKFLPRIAKLTKKAEKEIGKSIENIDSAVFEAIERSIPGIEGGIESLEQRASLLYEPVSARGKDLIINNDAPFRKVAKEVIEDIKTSLAPIPEEQAVVNLMEEALVASGKNPTAESFIKFYQGLNKAGRYLNPGQKERYFGLVKQSIVDTFRKQGSKGEQLADDFVKATQNYAKYKDAEKFIKQFENVISDGSIDFKKLDRQLSNPKKLKQYEKTLGKEETQNIKLLNQSAEKIKDLESRMKSGFGEKLFEGVKLWKFGKALIGLDLATLSAVVGAEAAQRLSARMLTDPKFQRKLLLMQQKAKDGAFNSLSNDLVTIIEESKAN